MLNRRVRVWPILNPAVIRYALFILNHQLIVQLTVAEGPSQTRSTFQAVATAIVPTYPHVWAFWLLDAPQYFEPRWVTIIKRRINMPALKASVAFLELLFRQTLGLDIILQSAHCQILEPVMVFALIAFPDQANVLRTRHTENFTALG